MAQKKNWKGLPKDRFWARTKIKGDCIEWTAGITKQGNYGLFAIGHNMILAHRFSYMLNKGEIPEGMLVCHSCDNPCCVKPEHLWLGTAKDNMQDMVRKGRNKPGGKSR